MKSFRKNDKKKIIKIGVFFLLFVFIIGYAYLTQNLNITGTSNFARTTWNIHFENLQNNTNMTLGQNDSAAAITQNKTNEVTYSISFNEPGQFYEFTVDAKNDGTLDGMIDNIVSTIKIGDGEVTPITTNPSNLPAYMAYSVTYSDGVQIEDNHLLKSGEKETYKVRVEFKTDVEPSDLPDTNQTIALTFGVEYVQKDDNAVSPGTILYTAFAKPTFGEEFPADRESFATSAALINYVTTSGVLDYQNSYRDKMGINYYLKYTLRNNIVKETAVELLITDELKQEFISLCRGDDDCIQKVNTINIGAYDFKVGNSRDDNGQCLPQYLDQNGACLNQYYDENVNTLRMALGSLFDNCSYSYNEQYKNEQWSCYLFNGDFHILLQNTGWNCVGGCYACCTPAGDGSYSECQNYCD